jgi:hypothetical protein
VEAGHTALLVARAETATEISVRGNVANFRFGGWNDELRGLARNGMATGATGTGCSAFAHLQRVGPSALAGSSAKA